MCVSDWVGMGVRVGVRVVWVGPVPADAVVYVQSMDAAHVQGCIHVQDSSW